MYLELNASTSSFPDPPPRQPSNPPFRETCCLITLYKERGQQAYLISACTSSLHNRV